MDQYLSRQQVRTIDQRAAKEYALPTLVLMERAGRGALATFLALGVHGPVLIVCGKGNNGGDGLVIARHLARCEVDLKVWLCGKPEELKGEVLANWKTFAKSGIPFEIGADHDDARFIAELGRVEWVIDALYGIGLEGPARPPAGQLINAINDSLARVFAVDVPSGLDADTGEPLGATIRAEHTATMVLPKKGFVNPAATTWTGKVHVIDIGVPERLVSETLQGNPV